jgi:isopropylmalate/homocitrate/citramalate synthase
MSDSVRIVEVGPRDGLQNEKTPVSVTDRITFIEALVGAGLHTVEVGAFVSPKAIPQMVNSDQVLRGVSHHRGVGELLTRQYQLLGRRIDRALQASHRPGQGRRHQGARLYLLRTRLPL